MPYADNNGIRIHYHVEGEGPPLVLQHGFSGSLEDWREGDGIVQALERDYKLILIDARGHGASDKPHVPEAYELPLRALDIVSVLDDLDIDKANYWGYSMGGWIGFGLAGYYPRRLASAIIGGAHPYSRSFEAFRGVLASGITTFADSFADHTRGIAPGFAERLYLNDAKALLALQQDRPDIKKFLPSMTMPCLLYAGETDPRFSQVRDCARHIPQATFFPLPGCDHLKAMFATDLVLPHVKKFLAEVDL